MIHFFVRFISALVISILACSTTIAQSNELLHADSLFSNQKYTEAYEKYEAIFNQDQSSPAMLTKMAFIQEGLGNYANALYYLNLYYLQSSDKHALTKMREIAEEHHLSGYEYSDGRFFENFIRKYGLELTLFLAAFSLFLLIYSFRKVQKEERPGISVAVQLLSLVSLFILNNELLLQDKAIISHDQSLLMSGPSGAAEPIESIAQGNKVTVLQSDELWSKIEWQDSHAYIRNKNIRKL